MQFTTMSKGEYEVLYDGMSHDSADTLDDALRIAKDSMERDDTIEDSSIWNGETFVGMVVRDGDQFVLANLYGEVL